MAKILGISGSLRRASFNSALLRAAVSLIPSGSTLEVGTIRGIPLYDADVEAEQGSPEAVSALKERVLQNQALLIVTPEYNNSLPGVLKNAIDWLSRPPADVARVFHDRPVAILGASPGRGGTIMSQAAWLPVLRTLGTRPWFGGRLQVADASHVFDAEGHIIDARIHGELERFITGFAAFVDRGS